MILSTSPVPRPEQWWLTRHKQKLDEKQQRNNDIDLLFLGDSITHSWEDTGFDVWQQFYAHRKPFNLGYAGDRTEHLIWRIQNGEVNGLSPKVIVMLIGTNNAGHRVEPAEETAAGVKLAIDELRVRLPNSKILLLAIFPRSKSPTAPMRARVNTINQQLETIADNQDIFWLDIGDSFLTQQGKLLDSVMPDYLHLNSENYKVWAKAMEPNIESLFAKAMSNFSDA